MDLGLRVQAIHVNEQRWARWGRWFRLAHNSSIVSISDKLRANDLAALTPCEQQVVRRLADMALTELALRYVEQREIDEEHCQGI